MVLRQDLPSVRQYLQGWTLMAADPPGRLRQWQSGEYLAEHIHDVWCLDDMARRLWQGWAAGENQAAGTHRQVVNTPALGVSNVFAIATAAYNHVCPST